MLDQETKSSGKLGILSSFIQRNKMAENSTHSDQDVDKDDDIRSIDTDQISRNLSRGGLSKRGMDKDYLKSMNHDKLETFKDLYTDLEKISKNSS